MAPTKSKKKNAALEVTPSKRTKTMAINQGQKQALIDNLQLEVTARARKLRAQYALLAQALRTRLEIRVNRIPLSMRKLKMQDLVDNYAAEARAKQEIVSKGIAVSMLAASAMPKMASKLKHTGHSTAAPPKRSAKRKSDSLEASADQENTPHDELSIPKKRIRMTAWTTAAASTTSNTTRPSPPKHMAESLILSPKSSNARIVPGSPFRTALASPMKSKLAGPYDSPSKPPAAINAPKAAVRYLNGMVEKAKTSRAKAVRKVTPSSKVRAPKATTTLGTSATATGVTAKGKRGAHTSTTGTAIKAKASMMTKRTEAPPVADRRVLRKRA